MKKREEDPRPKLKLTKLPEMPEELKQQLGQLFAEYLASFQTPEEQFLAMEALLQMCKGELRENHLPPAIKNALINCPPASAMEMATAGNAIMTDLDAALVHPHPKEAGDQVPSNFNAVNGSLYVQPKNADGRRRVEKRTERVLTKDGDQTTIDQLKVMEAPREDTRSLRRDILEF